MRYSNYTEDDFSYKVGEIVKFHFYVSDSEWNKAIILDVWECPWRQQYYKMFRPYSREIKTHLKVDVENEKYWTKIGYKENFNPNTIKALYGEVNV